MKRKVVVWVKSGDGSGEGEKGDKGRRYEVGREGGGEIFGGGGGRKGGEWDGSKRSCRGEGIELKRED